MPNYSTFKRKFTSFLKEKLHKDLFYHGLHHTMDVMDFVIEIAAAEQIKPKEMTLLKTAVMLHDAGFVETYIGHEEASCVLARQFLPDYGFSQEDIEIICGLIMATKIPQKPNTLLEKIIADADLLYLGTSKFKEIGDTLFNEMKIYSGVKDEQAWFKIQERFLSQHHYHTNYCKRNYEPTKQNNLNKVIAKIDKGYTS